MKDPTYMSYDELRDWVVNNPLDAARWIQGRIDRDEPSLGDLLGIGLDDD